MSHAGRLCRFLLVLALATACESRRGTVVNATIDVRCRSNADCPGGFACAADEHGPPITLCESDDPQARCPPGYDTKVRYGQRFCKPRRGAVAPVTLGAMSASTRSSLARRTGASHDHAAR